MRTFQLGQDPFADTTGFDALAMPAERGSVLTLLNPKWTVVVPSPGLIKIPLAFPLGGTDPQWSSVVNTWIDMKRRDGTLDALYDHWILGKDAAKRTPRWSVVRNVFGWGQRPGSGVRSSGVRSSGFGRLTLTPSRGATGFGGSANRHRDAAMPQTIAMSADPRSDRPHSSRIRHCVPLGPGTRGPPDPGSRTPNQAAMNILEAMLAAQGGGPTRQLGQQFGLDEGQVSSALSALVPALTAGLQRNMSSPQGLEGLTAALGGGQHQRYLDDVGTLGQADTIADGNGILGHIPGSKDVSRQVASRASAQTGIGEGVLKSMLPVVAAMMMGTMSKQAAGTGGVQASLSSGGSLLGMLAPMLDSNRDGSMVDDVLGMLGRFTRS